MNYIDINKEDIPYSFEIVLADELFTFQVGYNQSGDFFTVDVYKNGVMLVCGEKLVLNRPLFETVTNIELPKVKLIPKDRSNMAARITYDNMNDTVFLIVGDDSD